MSDRPKSELRKRLRAARREHVASLPESMRGLVFRAPPALLLERIAPDAVIGFYHAAPDEAPTRSYMSHFLERGHQIALPRFASRSAAMEFALHTDPYGDSDLEPGAFGIAQPAADAPRLVPDVLFVPLLGFTTSGTRLGQGGGHYDRWLAQHPGRLAIGLAWDIQRCHSLPAEAHDVVLDAVITPTRIYGPF